MKVEAVPLDQLEQQVRGCRSCCLCEGRHNTVFGEGDPHAGIMLIGEAPGKYEDQQGRPFVGPAGKLLDELLWHAHLRRNEVYIANVLKCRPPANRNPAFSEIEACAPFLRTQVQTVNPWLLITMGNFATQFILKTDTGVSHLRGTVRQTGRFLVAPVYHPAAALHDPTRMQVLVADFERIGRFVHDRMTQE